MEDQKALRVMTLSLSLLFGALLLNNIVTHILNIFEVSDLPILFYAVKSTITNLVVIGALLIAACHKQAFVWQPGRIVAFVLAALYSLFIVNWISMYAMEINIFRIFGAYTGLVIDGMVVVLMGIFMCSIKEWIAVKVLGILSFLPFLITSVMYRVLDNVWQYSYDNDNWEMYHRLQSVIDVVGYFNTVLFGLALLVTLVWFGTIATKKPKQVAKKIEMI